MNVYTLQSIATAQAPKRKSLEQSAPHVGVELPIALTYNTCATPWYRDAIPQWAVSSLRTMC